MDQMLVTSLLSIVVIILWGAFLTAASPLRWRAKNWEGLIAGLSWLLAMCLTLALSIQIDPRSSTMAITFLVTLVLSGRYWRRAHRGRRAKESYDEVRANRAT